MIYFTSLEAHASQDDVKVLKGYKAILGAMTEEELEDPELLKMPAKQRISDATSKVIMSNVIFYHTLLSCSERSPLICYANSTICVSCD